VQLSLPTSRPLPLLGQKVGQVAAVYTLQNTCTAPVPPPHLRFLGDGGSQASHVSAEFDALDEKCMASGFTT
jgi:hypothetical protein